MSTHISAGVSNPPAHFVDVWQSVSKRRSLTIGVVFTYVLLGSHLIISSSWRSSAIFGQLADTCSSSSSNSSAAAVTAAAAQSVAQQLANCVPKAPAPQLDGVQQTSDKLLALVHIQKYLAAGTPPHNCQQLLPLTSAAAWLQQFLQPSGQRSSSPLGGEQTVQPQLSLLEHLVHHSDLSSWAFFLTCIPVVTFFYLKCWSDSCSLRIQAMFRFVLFVTRLLYVTWATMLPFVWHEWELNHATGPLQRSILLARHAALLGHLCGLVRVARLGVPMSTIFHGQSVRLQLIITSYQWYTMQLLVHVTPKRLAERTLQQLAAVGLLQATAAGPAWLAASAELQPAVDTLVAVSRLQWPGRLQLLCTYLLYAVLPCTVLYLRKYLCMQQYLQAVWRHQQAAAQRRVKLEVCEKMQSATSSASSSRIASAASSSRSLAPTALGPLNLGLALPSAAPSEPCTPTGSRLGPRSAAAAAAAAIVAATAAGLPPRPPLMSVFADADRSTSGPPAAAADDAAAPLARPPRPAAGPAAAAAAAQQEQEQEVQEAAAAARAVDLAAALHAAVGRRRPRGSALYTSQLQAVTVSLKVRMPPQVDAAAVSATAGTSSSSNGDGPDVVPLVDQLRRAAEQAVVSTAAGAGLKVLSHSSSCFSGCLQIIVQMAAAEGDEAGQPLTGQAAADYVVNALAAALHNSPAWQQVLNGEQGAVSGPGVTLEARVSSDEAGMHVSSLQLLDSPMARYNNGRAFDDLVGTNSSATAATTGPAAAASRWQVGEAADPSLDCSVLQQQAAATLLQPVSLSVNNVLQPRQQQQQLVELHLVPELVSQLVSRGWGLRAVVLPHIGVPMPQPIDQQQQQQQAASQSQGLPARHVLEPQTPPSGPRRAAGSLQLAAGSTMSRLSTSSGSSSQVQVALQLQTLADCFWPAEKLQQQLEAESCVLQLAVPSSRVQMLPGYPGGSLSVVLLARPPAGLTQPASSTPEDAATMPGTSGSGRVGQGGDSWVVMGQTQQQNHQQQQQQQQQQVVVSPRSQERLLSILPLLLLPEEAAAECQQLLFRMAEELGGMAAEEQGCVDSSSDPQSSSVATQHLREAYSVHLMAFIRDMCVVLQHAGKGAAGAGGDDASTAAAAATAAAATALGAGGLLAAADQTVEVVHQDLLSFLELQELPVLQDLLMKLPSAAAAAVADVVPLLPSDAAGAVAGLVAEHSTPRQVSSALNADSGSALEHRWSWSVEAAFSDVSSVREEPAGRSSSSSGRQQQQQHLAPVVSARSSSSSGFCQGSPTRNSSSSGYSASSSMRAAAHWYHEQMGGARFLLKCCWSGFPGASMERAYQLYKARQVLPLDLVTFALKMCEVCGTLVKGLALTIQQEGAGLVMRSVLAYLVVTMVPSVLLVASAQLYWRHRNRLLFWCQVGTVLVGFPSAMALYFFGVGWASLQLAKQVLLQVYSRPVAVIVWVHIVTPLLLQLSLKAHAVVALLRLLEGGLMYMMVLRGNASPWLLGTSYLVSNCVAWLVLTMLELRLRKRFLATVQAAKHAKAH